MKWFLKVFLTLNLRAQWLSLIWTTLLKVWIQVLHKASEKIKMSTELDKNNHVTIVETIIGLFAINEEKDIIAYSVFMTNAVRRIAKNQRQRLARNPAIYFQVFDPHIRLRHLNNIL